MIRILNIRMGLARQTKNTQIFKIHPSNLQKGNIRPDMPIPTTMITFTTITTTVAFYLLLLPAAIYS